MKRKQGTWLLGAGGLAAAMLVSPWARASGFLLYDQSGEAAGKVSAVVASTNEPAAVWYNPAGLSWTAGYQASVSGFLYYVRLRFDDRQTGAETKPNADVFVIPSVFASAQLTDSLHAGFGAYTAFGLGAAWPNDWQGRDQTIASDLQTVTLNPTLSYRIGDRLSVGAGFDAMRAAVDMTNGLPAPVGGEVRVGGATWGYGGNAGLMVRILPELLHAGLAYRSRIKLTFRGKADFSPGHPEFLRDLPDQGGTATATLPDIITAGVMLRPWPEVAFTAEASLVSWSTWDQLALEFDSAPPAVSNYQFHNAVLTRIGADLPTPVARLRIRTGLMFEQKAAREEYLSPSVPDSHVLDTALGAGYSSGWLKLDAGYVLGMNLPSKARGGVESPEGTYWAVSHAVGLTVTARSAGHE